MSIEDVGELIPHAAKHKSRATNRVASTNLLKTLLPEPDWLQLHASGKVAPHTLSAMACVYWGLSKGPIAQKFIMTTPQQWEPWYRDSIAAIGQVFSQASDETHSQLREKYNQLMGDQGLSKTDARKRLYACGRTGGRTLNHPFVLTSKYLVLYENMHDLGWPETDACLKASISIYPVKDQRQEVIACWRVMDASQYTWLTPEQHSTREQALAQARDLIEKRLNIKVEARKTISEIRNKRYATQAQRVGPDWRGGRFIYPEELQNTFGLAGIQFGESLSQTERQKMLNQAYDAMMDLSSVLGFKPRWMGLNKGGGKRLALALAARGKGGAVAHYEPGYTVINLTRENGAGSLAHEWAHALDHHLADFTLVNERSFGCDSIFRGVLEFPGQHPAHRPLQALAQQLLRRDTPYFGQARALDAMPYAKRNYWSDPTEMLARAFEAWVGDEIAKQGQSNSWLVTGTSEAEMRAMERQPYPVGECRVQLNAAFRAIFNVLGERNQPA